MPNPRPFDEIKQFITKNKYTLLSNDYPGSVKKMKMLCPNGHICYISWNSFLHDTRCRKCADLTRCKLLAKPYNQVKQHVESFGYTIISPYLNSWSKLDMLCPNEHNVKISWNSFYNGSRCNKCSSKRRLSLQEVKDIFKKESYLVLSTSYSNVETKLQVVCPENHHIVMTVHGFLRGTRCKKCFANKLKLKKGPFSPRYNHSVSLENRMLDDWQRHSFSFNQWRFAVFERDGFQCRLCHQLGPGIQAHHVFNFKDYVDLRLFVSNGITLCDKHHYLFHKIYGKSHNNNTQLRQFFDDYHQQFKQSSQAMKVAV